MHEWFIAIGFYRLFVVCVSRETPERAGNENTGDAFYIKEVNTYTIQVAFNLLYSTSKEQEYGPLWETHHHLKAKSKMNVKIVFNKDKP